MKSAKTLLLTILVIGVYILHQDFWNWKKAEPLVFGFLPIGLAYHAGYSILASITMALLVKFAWPAHLESAQPEPQPGRAALSSARRDSSDRGALSSARRDPPEPQADPGH